VESGRYFAGVRYKSRESHALAPSAANESDG
jgi:hypothetical protein